MEAGPQEISLDLSTAQTGLHTDPLVWTEISGLGSAGSAGAAPGGRAHA